MVSSFSRFCCRSDLLSESGRAPPWLSSRLPSLPITAPTKAASWGWVANAERPTVVTLKRALLAHGPLAVGLYATPGLHSPQRHQGIFGRA